MSARMETEPISWESAERGDPDATRRALSELPIEGLVRHTENDLAGPLREAALQAEDERTDLKSETKRYSSMPLQEQWKAWSAKRDEMRLDIKRGKECLEQVQRELAALRGRLEEWRGYETICGTNPLHDYMQAIATKERVEQYLPGWLKRREEQLRALDRQLENYARDGAENSPDGAPL